MPCCEDQHRGDEEDVWIPARVARGAPGASPQWSQSATAVGRHIRAPARSQACAPGITQGRRRTARPRTSCCRCSARDARSPCGKLGTEQDIRKSLHRPIGLDRSERFQLLAQTGRRRWGGISRTEMRSKGYPTLPKVQFSSRTNAWKRHPGSGQTTLGKTFPSESTLCPRSVRTCPDVQAIVALKRSLVDGWHGHQAPRRGRSAPSTCRRIAMRRVPRRRRGRIERKK
ncbi:hypothetical protein ACVWWO_005181 [Bradyrhizobium sp. F1.13.1]